MARRGGKLAGTARADAMRRHREIFEYGVANGLSLKDAEVALNRARHAAMIEGIRARKARPASDAPIGRNDPSDKWMMRD